jgi:hypothetical protein
VGACIFGGDWISCSSRVRPYDGDSFWVGWRTLWVVSGELHEFVKNTLSSRCRGYLRFLLSNTRAMQDSYTIPISDQQTKTAVPLLLFCVGVPEFVFAVGVGVDVAALLLLFCCCCSVVAVLLLLFCCCCSVFAVLLLLFCCCCSVVAVLLLLFCCCCSVVAVLLLLFCCCCSVLNCSAVASMF